jgi:hypothetical protein
MTKESLKKIADEVLMFEYLEKIAGVDVKKNYKDINKAFNSFISNQLFEYKGKKVPYLELPHAEREKVWDKFWSNIGDQFKTFEKLVDETIDRLKQPLKPAVSRY